MSTYLDHLTAIRDEHGRLDYKLIELVARAPEHPLHSYFEWDNEVAGLHHRWEQARQLLRVVKLPPSPGRPNDLRAFVAVKGENSHKADYVPTEEALADDFTRTLVLRDMNRDWQLLKRRYEHMHEFAELIRRHLQEKAS